MAKRTAHLGIANEVCILGGFYECMLTRLGWLGFAVLCFGIVAWKANRMLYYPSKFPAGNWAVQQMLQPTEVFLQASDGTRLHGWWISAPSKLPGVSHLASLHLHGNAGNITHREQAARHIRAGGSSVLLLDYRGYGKSDGKPSEKGVYLDAEAGYDWLLRQGYAPEQIVIHGESLGTAVATYLASTRKSAGLILEAPFTSAKAVAHRVVPVLGRLLVWGYNSAGRLNKIHIPVLIIHGDRDEVIAYQFGEEMFRRASSPKYFWKVSGAMHNDLHSVGDAEFSARLAAFYRTLPVTKLAPHDNRKDPPPPR